MRISARAKINWTLAVTGVREDGYHLLDTLMQQIDIADEVTIEEADELTFDVAGHARVPSGDGNLALRAAKLLRAETGCARGARITLEKHIPVGAGLGGGSADAAAVLHGLNALWGANLPPDKLLTLGLSLGADVPYCLTGGLVRARGIGEVLAQMPPSARDVHLVVIQPCRGASTRDIFSRFKESDARPDAQGAARALAQGDLYALSACMGNALQATTACLLPDIRRAVAALREHGARAAQMTGSGSAVFGVFANAQSAQSAENALRRRFPYCKSAKTV